jgi:hypothetical protein
MKKLILISVLALSILSCKRDEVEPDVSYPIRSITSVPYDTVTLYNTITVYDTTHVCDTIK